MSSIDSTTWPTKYVGERVTAEFDFARDVPAGDSVASVALVVTTVAGVDAAPAGVLYGSSVIKGARVFQQLAAGLAGRSYRVECRATTANNNILILARVLPVIALT